MEYTFLINININKNAQCYLRELVLENIDDVLNNLPLINSYEDVLIMVLLKVLIIGNYMVLVNQVMMLIN